MLWNRHAFWHHLERPIKQFYLNAAWWSVGRVVESLRFDVNAIGATERHDGPRDAPIDKAAVGVWIYLRIEVVEPARQRTRIGDGNNQPSRRASVLNQLIRNRRAFVEHIERVLAVCS